MESGRAVMEAAGTSAGSAPEGSVHMAEALEKTPSEAESQVGHTPRRSMVVARGPAIDSDLTLTRMARSVFRVPAEFTLRNSREAQAVLRGAAARGARVEWADSPGITRVGVVVEEQDGARLRADDARELPCSTNVSFELHGVPLTAQCRLEDGRVVELLTVRSTENRASTRATPRKAAHLEWFATGEGDHRPHRAPIVDLCGTGACSLHAHGNPIPDSGPFVATLWLEDRFVHCTAEVRSRRTTVHGEELGLEILPGDPGEMAELVLGELFPRLRPRRRILADDVVRLFEKSGYLKLRDGCRPSAAWLGLDADSLSRDLVYVADNGDAVGHSSITRAYRHTWIAHQTAMLSQHEDAVEARASLLLGLTTLASLLDGHGTHVIAYYDRSKPYGRVFFEEFAQNVSSGWAAAVTVFDRFERAPVPLALDFDAPTEATVRVAEDRELALIATLVRRHLPPLFAQAMDMEPSLLRKRSLHPAYESSPFERGREVLVLRIGGSLAGVAFCEYTTRDLTLFNTMNLAQVHVFGPVSDAAQRLLQYHVRAFYEARGILDPLVVSPPGTFRAELDPHVKLVETMGAIAWSFEGLRAYENYLRLRFAWLREGRRFRPRANRPVHSSLFPRSADG